jgi:DNA-formamidopyrimidine glycosylase
MPEGHTVHRTANEFNKLFAGEKISVTSPQGRFASDSKLISERKLVKASAIGKQLFLKFENDLTLRIHLGIYGKWNFSTFENEPPTPVGQVRARFVAANKLADLRGPTVCEVITNAEVKKVENRLGPDPLNPDSKGTEELRFIKRVQKSNSPIGQLLMNQEIISGIGNVYRAEILFRAGISPHRLGKTLSEEQLREIWRDSVKLLRVGVKTGFMITRDELRNRSPNKADRNFVYKREGLPCRVCNTNLTLEIMATRKLYWCVGCQN